MRKLWLGVAALTISGLSLSACGGDQRPAKAGAPAAPDEAPSVAVTLVKSESRTFRDWYAVCDNGNLCSAYAGGDTGWILIQMEAGPEGQPTVRVGMWPEDGDALKTPIVLVIDGKRHSTSPGPDETSSSVLRGTDARTVIAELAAGRALGLASGEQTVDLPVAGSSASLLWFDERQGRLDTTTALVRKGAKPASTVPATPQLPTIVAGPAVSQSGFAMTRETVDGEVMTHPTLPASLLAVPTVKQCRDDTTMNEYLSKSVTAARLNAVTELWGVPCSSGAYNQSFAYYLTGPQGANPRLIFFPDADGKPRPSAEGDDMWLTNPNYDPETRTMTAFAKGRGIGDCGVDQTWTWTGEAFVLNHERVMSDCFGITSELWPTTFRSR